MVTVIIIIALFVVAAIAASTSARNEKNKKAKIPTRVLDYYERHEKNLPNVTSDEKHSSAELTEEILFEVVGIDNRPAHIRQIVANLQPEEELELMVGFKGNQHIVEVFADFYRIGYVEDDAVEDIYRVIVNDGKYECKVFANDVDWDSEITENGDFEDIVSEIYLSALFRYEPLETTRT